MTVKLMDLGYHVIVTDNNLKQVPMPSRYGTKCEKLYWAAESRIQNVMNTRPQFIGDHPGKVQGHMSICVPSPLDPESSHRIDLPRVSNVWSYVSTVSLWQLFFLLIVCRAIFPLSFAGPLGATIQLLFWYRFMAYIWSKTQPGKVTKRTDPNEQLMAEIGSLHVQMAELRRKAAIKKFVMKKAE